MYTWILLFGAILVLYFIMFGRVKGLVNLPATNFKKEWDESSQGVLIDVREPGEYRSGHIPKALNIPLSQLGNRMNEIPKDRRIFLYCQSGMRSRQAGRILSKQGYQNITNLQGGIMSWNGNLKK